MAEDLPDSKQSPEMNTSNLSMTSSTPTSSGSSLISITSESDLKIGGVLFDQLTSLKSTYLRILRIFDPATPLTCTESEVVMLNRDQLVAGQKKHKLKKEKLEGHIYDLLESVRPICLPGYKLDTAPRSKPVKYSQEIELVLQRVETSFSSNSLDFNRMQEKVESLEKTISELKLTSPGVQPHQPTPNLELSIPPCGPVVHNVSHLETDKYQVDFITETEKTELTECLGKIEYESMAGRDICKFGENYKFHGSRQDSKPPPPLIKGLMDKLNSAIGDSAPLVNSCLVTRYTGPEGCIPLHSDNERALQHDSFIYTLSIGKEATVKFNSTQADDAFSLTPADRSLYVMSRRSNDLFRHQIEKDPSWAPTDTRISLTFRTLHWRNNNSTLIMGDSNTKRLNFAMPRTGTRVTLAACEVRLAMQCQGNTSLPIPLRRSIRSPVQGSITLFYSAGSTIYGSLK